jgi:hypothetical protein
MCLITSFAPVRDGSATCRSPLPVGRFTPFYRSLASPEIVSSREKMGDEKGQQFDKPETIPPFSPATYQHQYPTSEGRRQAYQTYRRQWTVSVREAVRLQAPAM